MNDNERTTILLAEYHHLREDQRMYIRQLFGMFSLFSILMLSVLAYALKETSDRLTFAAVPIFSFILTYFGIYLMQCAMVVVSRIREIEYTFRVMNQDESLIQWESRYGWNVLGRHAINLEIDNSRRVKSLNACIYLLLVQFLVNVLMIGYSLQQLWCYSQILFWGIIIFLLVNVVVIIRMNLIKLFER